VDAIVTLDPLGRITFVSKGGLRMFGYGEDEMIGRPVRALWACGPRDFRAFRARLVRSAGWKTRDGVGDGQGSEARREHLGSFLRGAAGEVTGILAS